jgi:glycosyltransferase involved in cell wall biosynthesis
MSTPSVLILSNCFAPNVGGVETHLTDLTTALAQRGWQVKVLAFYPHTTRVAWKRYEEQAGGGIQIWRLWWFGHNWFHVLEKYPPLQFLYLVPRLFVGTLVWLIQRHRSITVIHAHGLAAGFCARILGRWFNKRIVLSSHAVYNFQTGSGLSRMVRWILSGMDATLTLSEQSREELIRIGLAPERVKTYQHWIDFETFSPGDRVTARTRLGVRGSDPVCLFVGRLIAPKGVRLFLELARDSRFQTAQFWVAGVGPLENEVQAEAASNPKVRFLGNINNADLPDYYRAADILCVPSQYQEGFGRVILEAMACGTPVLASDCPGIREALAGEGGWLVPATREGFAERLRELFARPEDLAGRRRACRRLVESRYSDRNVDAIEQALKAE